MNSPGANPPPARRGISRACRRGSLSLAGGGLQSQLLRHKVIYLGQRVVQLQHVRAAALVGAKSAPLGTA